VFYLKYDMYRNSWPLLALATYRKLLTASLKSAHGDLNGSALPRKELNAMLVERPPVPATAGG